MNLPTHLCVNGIWTLNGQLIVGPKKRDSLGIDIELLKAGIVQNGFYLWNANVAPLLDKLRLMR